MSDLSIGPIGVFDSGVGGLTVLNELINLLPNEDFIYLGDTARVPYGTKSNEEIIRAAKENIAFLIRKGVKAIVVACNSASAVALPILETSYDLPVMGVVEAGSKFAVKSGYQRIAVIGTRATISSGAYSKYLLSAKGDLFVVNKSCPLFVPLVEEGWVDNEITSAVVTKYLVEIQGNVDALILGCTHYPLLKGIISKVLPGIDLIDSAEVVAQSVKIELDKKDLLNDKNNKNKVEVYLTDNAPNFSAMAERILGYTVEPIICDL